jgi:hypothetical protein
VIAMAINEEEHEKRVLVKLEPIVMRGQKRYALGIEVQKEEELSSEHLRVIMYDTGVPQST